MTTEWMPTLLETHGDKIVVVPSGCHIWIGAQDSKGYGSTCMNGASVKAHRAAYELERGPIPEGLVTDHLCRQPSCVNVDHLEPVTNAENIRRGRSKERERTHCPQGHPYDEENTSITTRGHRQCRACARRWWRERQAPDTRTACAKGHALTPENTYTYPTGQRRCIQCRRAYDRARYRAEVSNA